MPNDPRKVLEHLCAERGEDFAGLSRLLGKNPAYIQQYIKRGTPKRLREEERRTLAHYFQVPESMLGGPEGSADAFGLVGISRSPVHASAGPGAIVGDETAQPYFAVDRRWLKGLTAAAPGDLSIIRVEGDSMAPTLNDGDDILVDTSDREARLRDGIYVLRVEGNLLVKRLAVHPFGKRVTVQSDNPAYPDWPDCGLAKIDCIGRVIWAGRKVA
jgi:phage repressor protein C with HTH and peptisase S24 domain